MYIILLPINIDVSGVYFRVVEEKLLQNFIFNLKLRSRFHTRIINVIIM